MTLVGPNRHGPEPPQVVSTDHYSSDEFFQLLLRAGRLLNIQNKEPSGDVAGMRRFVAIAVREFRTLIHEEDGRRVFVDGAHICALTAGYLSGGRQASKQTIDQTNHPPKTAGSRTKPQRGKKPWTPLATALKKRWFAEMRRRKRWIARMPFLRDFLQSTEGKLRKWRRLTISTEDRRFQDNDDQWQVEAMEIKASMKQRAQNRR